MTEVINPAWRFLARLKPGTNAMSAWFSGATRLQMKTVLFIRRGTNRTGPTFRHPEPDRRLAGNDRAVSIGRELLCRRGIRSQSQRRGRLAQSGLGTRQVHSRRAPKSRRARQRADIAPKGSTLGLWPRKRRPDPCAQGPERLDVSAFQDGCLGRIFTSPPTITNRQSFYGNLREILPM
jgi:hypothetical protein